MSRSHVTLILLVIMIISAIKIPISVFGESEKGVDQLREGISLFKQGDYQQAVLSFRSIIFDPEEEVYRPDAYFWIFKAYMAMDNLEDAERNLEFFLNNYPDHIYFSEALYQKGRLLFKQGEFENAIQLLQNFISSYPDSEYIPNAYFWIGESLYSFGQLEEAALIFTKIKEDYPKSFKIEASLYRLSLIEFKKRENELLKLLKWSHEESLKTIEEFQRREKTYEQAIASYQKRLSNLKQEGVHSNLIKEIEQLKRENASLKSRIEILKNQQMSLQSEQAPDESLMQKSEELEKKLKLLQIKEEALTLKESLLDLIEKSPEKR